MIYKGNFFARTRVAVAQLVARKSHNPKVVSSILTCHTRDLLRGGMTKTGVPPVGVEPATVRL